MQTAKDTHIKLYEFIWCILYIVILIFLATAIRSEKKLWHRKRQKVDYKERQREVLRV
jgi:hypothetical protein